MTLAWTVVANESYLVCWDTTHNGACDSTWVAAGLAPGTYSWQVKTGTGGVAADNGAWRSVTVVAAPTFGKQAPTTGTTGLGSLVTLQWSALPNEGYWVCWDTTNNNTCDTTWWPNGAGTYRFTVITDDGSRLWIDDQPTIAAWWDQGPVI